MSKTPNLDVLAYGDSPIGTICLRRRELLASPGTAGDDTVANQAESRVRIALVPVKRPR